jgi:hypothetical protein
MLRHRNAQFFESVTKLIYSGTTLTNHNFIHEKFIIFAQCLETFNSEYFTSLRLSSNTKEP